MKWFSWFSMGPTLHRMGVDISAARDMTPEDIRAEGGELEWEMETVTETEGVSVMRWIKLQN